MEKNESFKGKITKIGIPTFKMKRLNLFKSCSLKKKPSRNIFFDEKFLSKNNENTTIISDPSINIFYKNEQKRKEKNEIHCQETSNDNYLSKTNYFSGTNKKLSFDSNFQGRKNGLNYFPDLTKDKNVLNNSEYKKRLKKINSSFSRNSCYNLEKKIFKDFSKNCILYNNSLFSSYKKQNIQKINLKKWKDVKLRYNKSFWKEKINFNGKFIPNRKLYEFIEDPFSYGKIVNMKDLFEKFKKFDKKIEKILEMDNNKLFNKNYSIIEKSRFRKKFQNPFIYDNYNLQGKEEEYKRIINPQTLKDRLQLLEEMKEEINKIKKANVIFNGYKEITVKKINNKKILFEKFRRFVIRLSQFLKQGKISDKEMKRFKLIRQSFTYVYTKTLIDSIKSKNYDLSCAIIEKHKYLVLDFDYYYLTPLHWAVKKNFYEFLPKLLDYGSIIDSINFIGETPLHIAVKYNFYDSVCILLYYLASPFTKNREGKKPIEIANEFDMKSFLERVMKIHYLSFFQKNANQQRFIKKNIWIFINEVFKSKISEYVYNIIKDKELFDL